MIGAGTNASTAWHVARHAIENPRATAIVEGARQVNYSEFAADLVRVVAFLERQGVVPGTLVGVELLRGRYVHLLLLLACEVIGAATTYLVADASADNDPVLPHCGVLVARDTAGFVAPVKSIRIRDDFLPALRDEPQPSRPLDVLRRPIEPARVTRIVRTSGTTGRPKAIALTNQVAQRTIDALMRRIHPDVLPEMRFLCIYNFGLRGVYLKVLGTLQHGGTIILAAEKQVPRLISSGFINYLIMVVGDADRLVERCGPLSHGEGPEVDLIGARVSPRLRALIADRIGRRICLRYSSNETATIADAGEDDVNVLVEGAEARIVDRDDRDVPQGETGLILIRTRTMADGYFNDSVQTAASFVNGWFRTNDLGYIPEPGKLVVLGRADDMLNIGGMKVAPGPMEDMIKALHGVWDAVLIAPAGPTGVGRLVVAIECDGGRLRPGLDAEVRHIVAQSGCAFDLLSLPSFPRTETGKVRRSEIEAAFRRRFA